MRIHFGPFVRRFVRFGSLLWECFVARCLEFCLKKGDNIILFEKT